MVSGWSSRIRSLPSDPASGSAGSRRRALRFRRVRARRHRPAPPSTAGPWRRPGTRKRPGRGASTLRVAVVNSPAPKLTAIDTTRRSPTAREESAIVAVTATRPGDRECAGADGEPSSGHFQVERADRRARRARRQSRELPPSGVPASVRPARQIGRPAGDRAAHQTGIECDPQTCRRSCCPPRATRKRGTTSSELPVRSAASANVPSSP